MARRERGDAAKGGPQTGAIGMASDPHQIQEGADRDAPELRGDLGVGGQRHQPAQAGGSSRDPAAQGRRTKEETQG